MKDNQKKNQIIKAAEKRFIRHGLNKTTMDEIARDLRISKASIYHYFKSKEEIYVNVISYSHNLQINQLEEKIKSNENLTIERVLWEFLLFKADIKNSNKIVFGLIVNIISEVAFEEELAVFQNLIQYEKDFLTKMISEIQKNKIKKTLNDALTFIINDCICISIVDKFLNTRQIGTEKQQRTFVFKKCI